MLKTVSRSNPGWHGTFPKRCFFCASDRKSSFSRLPAWKKEDHTRSRGMVFSTTKSYLVALDFVWDRAKEDRTEEKTIFIDECWQLLSGAGATGTRLVGDFVLEIFKTIRGYGGFAVCASRDLF